MISIHPIFWYNLVSLKDRTSSILTLLNRYLKRFTLKNCFLMRTKALHSMRTFLKVQGVWHVKYCGCCSCFRMKEWVSLVWLMGNRDIMTSSFLDFLKAGLRSPKVGWIWKNLLRVFLFQCSCHFAWRSLLIWGFRSVYSILNFLGSDLRPIWLPSPLFHFLSLQRGWGSRIWLFLINLTLSLIYQ